MIGKLEKPEELVEFTWRHAEQQAFGVMNIKAGQTTKVPARAARGLELGGHGNIGSSLKPYVRDESKIREFLAEEAKRNPGTQQPEMVLVDYNSRTGRPRYAPDGWLEAAERW